MAKCLAFTVQDTAILKSILLHVILQCVDVAPILLPSLTYTTLSVLN